MNHWRVDETSIKIKGTWTYLSRAVDAFGNTLEFLLSPTRDAEAAKSFFLKALHSTARSAPQARPFEESMTQSAPPADLKTIPSATWSTIRFASESRQADRRQLLLGLRP